MWSHFRVQIGVSTYFGGGAGQDDLVLLYFEMNLFFDGFKEMATCAEGVVRHLTERYPDAPVVHTHHTRSTCAHSHT